MAGFSAHVDKFQLLVYHLGSSKNLVGFLELPDEFFISLYV
ncbi:hypothetical protein [Treponema denticola]|nr:hypothetical protein [Treponema denticola]